MTKVTDYIAQAKKTIFSIEILPPVKTQTIQDLFDDLDPMMEAGPAFVDVTFHREDYVFAKTPDGAEAKTPIRKRPGTVGVCAALQTKYGVDTVPHVLCGGATKSQTENMLVDLSYLGIENVLALQGDKLKSQKAFTPDPDGHTYASELTAQIAALNEGKSLTGETEYFKTDFCIGVAGYPEKHYAAPDMQTDMLRLKEKVEAGAEYIVTQMFFDNQYYFDFVEKCRAMGITVPIIPGIKPLALLNQIEVLPRIFALSMPEAFVNEVKKCKTNAEARQAGVEWCIAQSKELKEKGAPIIHYYTMSKSKSMMQVLKAVF